MTKFFKQYLTELILGHFLSSAILLSSTSTIVVSMFGDIGNVSETVSTGTDDSVNVNMMLSRDNIENSVSSSGNFTDCHTANDGSGVTASVYVNITAAKSYNYNYRLNDDPINPESQEKLDIINAKEINAYAEAVTSDGNRARSKISVVDGSLQGYSNAASISKGILLTNQRGHIEIKPDKGRFVSTVRLYDKTIERTSNYDTKHGFETRTDEVGCLNQLSYYVDKANTHADSIQRAIDASWDGDIIKVAPGKYKENLVVDKSLKIVGSRVDDTFIDGRKKDSVVKILGGKDVVLPRLTIQNSRASDGAGIFNLGNLTIDNCVIKNNASIS